MVKLQRDYGVEYAKNQLLIMVLEPTFTLKYQDKVAQLYSEKSMLDLLIEFHLDLECETWRILNFTAFAHKLQKS